MKARIHITLKNGVLDPEGKAIEGALGALGFQGVGDVRKGKYIEIALDGMSRAEAEDKTKAMCERLLANTVIENYTIDLEG